MVRGLQVVAGLAGGGVAKRLYDYYRNMDHTKIHFDFLIYDYYENGMYEEPLKDLGCTIYKLPRIKKDKIGYLTGMKKIIKDGFIFLCFNRILCSRMQRVEDVGNICFACP